MAGAGGEQGAREAAWAGSREAAWAASMADAATSMADAATSMADGQAASMARGGGSLHRRLLSAGARRLLPSGARQPLPSSARWPLPSSMARDGHYRGAPPSGVGCPKLHWRAAVLLSLSLSPGTSEHGRAAVRIPGSGERRRRAWLSGGAASRVGQAAR
ncbi:hypothetical protein VPH35_041674 [Triticum aestivum]